MRREIIQGLKFRKQPKGFDANELADKTIKAIEARLSVLAGAKRLPRV